MSSASRLADLALLRFIAPSHPTLSRRVLPVVSAAADRGVLWVGTAGVLAGLGGRRGRRAAAEGMLALGAASALVNGPLKHVIGRPRPGAGLARFVIRERGRAPSTSSMPSGHATSAAAFAVAAGAAMPVMAAPLTGLAALVAWSRISGGRHFPTDVAVGMAAGAAAGLAGHLAAEVVRPSDAEVDVEQHQRPHGDGEDRREDPLERPEVVEEVVVGGDHEADHDPHHETE